MIRITILDEDNSFDDIKRGEMHWSNLCELKNGGRTEDISYYSIKLNYESHSNSVVAYLSIRDTLIFV